MKRKQIRFKCSYSVCAAAGDEERLVYYRGTKKEIMGRLQGSDSGFCIDSLEVLAEDDTVLWGEHHHNDTRFIYDFFTDHEWREISNRGIYNG